MQNLLIKCIVAQVAAIIDNLDSLINLTHIFGLWQKTGAMRENPPGTMRTKAPGIKPQR